MKTISAKREDIKRDWYVVDAEDQVLGRLASRVASILRGKHKPVFTTHVDTGDFVVVVNADKIRVTGSKLSNEVYYHHTGYPDGLKSKTMGKFLKEKPEEFVRSSIRGMLPKNKLGRAMLKKLKIYRGPEHPHEAQEPKPLEIGE
ncbi:MAG: 50S ribosomal protein L13 [Nitrospirae bacterium RIFCSPHIGHO2_02_FULL_42_12]|nr:MAG: 50S ribosomal protein L13 [Nitrospirae bacterium RIFCSPHIGHO2_02_FULL_42_12]HAS18063.1 50S ribosomal protein L13 [Nitrospiraceae bacterium]